MTISDKSIEPNEETQKTFAFARRIREIYLHHWDRGPTTEILEAANRLEELQRKLNVERAQENRPSEEVLSEKITPVELQAIFGHEMPLVAVKILAPEQSQPLTTDEIRVVLKALAAERTQGRDWAAIEKLLPEIEKSLEAAKSWIELWAPHVGNCRGEEICECGKTFINFELSNFVIKLRAAIGKE